MAGADGTGARNAPCAMHKELGRGREVVVDDAVEERNVEPARRHVRHLKGGRSGGGQGWWGAGVVRLGWWWWVGLEKEQYGECVPVSR